MAMLIPDRSVLIQDTAADADALSGTDLAQAPGEGIYVLFCASTVNTATIRVPKQGSTNTQVIPLKTNGIPIIDEQIPLVWQVKAGEAQKVDLGGTTGTIHTWVAFYSIGRLQSLQRAGLL